MNIQCRFVQLLYLSVCVCFLDLDISVAVGIIIQDMMSTIDCEHNIIMYDTSISLLIERLHK